jgi:hypothetical protein
MGHHVSARAELLDHLEAARFLHEHALGLVIYMARLHDETGWHTPDELALTGRQREKLLASGIAAFAHEFDQAFVRALQSQLVDVSAKSLVKRRFAATASLLFIVCQRSSLPLSFNQPATHCTIETGAVRPNMR